jgi:adenylate cyclase
MGAKLTIQPASADPFEMCIGNTATIGRTRENTVCLNFSPLVSRQHAIIRCHNGFQYQIIDLGSRNGTYVDDQRVVMPVALTSGARIRIADNTITFGESEDQCAEHSEVTIAGSMASSGLEARPVALLVCDIRGFSSMSEKTESGKLAQILGAWFRETGNLVTRSGGTVDKFIGDAILAYWGTTGVPTDDCRAAFEIAHQMHDLAAGRTWPNGGPFQIAVALHYGKVTCSNVGIVAERDATIIGDAVNTVFRLEAVSKELKQPLIVSGDFQAHVPDLGTFVPFGAQSLKGKAKAVDVFGCELHASGAAQ